MLCGGAKLDTPPRKATFTLRLIRALFGSILGVLALQSGAGARANASSLQPGVGAQRGSCFAGPIRPGTPTYVVEGRVIDDVTGLPVPGATVTLRCQAEILSGLGRREIHNSSLETMTDQVGKFAFSGIPKIYVNLTASRNGYIPVWWVRLTADESFGDYSIGPGTGFITLRLAPTASTSGIVRDDKGAPMPGAWVTLRVLRTQDGWPYLEYDNSEKTDAQGHYHFGPLQPGRYYLVAAASLRPDGPQFTDAIGAPTGYVPLRFPPLNMGGGDTFLKLAEGEEKRIDFQFHLDPLYRVTGRITGAGDGLPIVDAVDWSGSKAYSLKTWFAKTAPRCCRFEAWLPSGHFRLMADYTGPEGRFVGSMPLEVANTKVSGVVFHPIRDVPIKVPIETIGVGSQPFGGACPETLAPCGLWYLQLIRLKSNGYIKTGPASTMSGGMRHEGTPQSLSVTVDPGAYAVLVATWGNVYAQSITRRGVNLLTQPLVVSAEDAADPIRVTLGEGATVKGTTERGGKPVRAWVYAIPERPDARFFQPVRSQPNGEFEFQGLAPIPYLFFATDIELHLDIHDPKVLAYYRQHAQLRFLEEGGSVQIVLHEDENQ